MRDDLDDFALGFQIGIAFFCAFICAIPALATLLIYW